MTHEEYTQILPGMILWDSVHRRYGVIIEHYKDASGEVRLDSDGVRNWSELYIVHSEGDEGTKVQLTNACRSYSRLYDNYPGEYPKLIFH